MNLSAVTFLGAFNNYMIEGLRPGQGGDAEAGDNLMEVIGLNLVKLLSKGDGL